MTVTDRPASGHDEPLLRATGLSVMRGRRPVLHEIDLQLHAGELVLRLSL